MLPQIFRADDPAGNVLFAPEDRVALRKLVTDQQREGFLAEDSLGWVYQFWQAQRKEEVNASGTKIGADEISPVTQLFTEDYMVDFLLDNTLGAWWAGKNASKLVGLQSEEECRQALALPGVNWEYLRFVKDDPASHSDLRPPTSDLRSPASDLRPPTSGSWRPAAGTFDGWPQIVAQLKCLDPCCGSGHFIVALFKRLSAMRLAEEGLTKQSAAVAVIRDNLFGLEIDPRCTQIAAFNLALAAWKFAGYCELPPVNLACSGLAPNTREADWLAIAGDNEKLKNGMERLYRSFKDAPVLGSLINPRADEGDLLVAAFHELQPLLEKALVQETKDDTAHEMAVTAHGLAKAAEILAGQFTLVATNVPYLGRGKQDEVLQDYCEKIHTDAKADLATCFVERCLGFCASGGSAALVTPQPWMFLGTYKKLRCSFLAKSVFDFVARLGPKGFQTPMWDFEIMLLCMTNITPERTTVFSALDVSEKRDPHSKSLSLLKDSFLRVEQAIQIHNPDARIRFSGFQTGTLLSAIAQGLHGQGSFDDPAFVFSFWETSALLAGWVFQQTTGSNERIYSGLTNIFRWEDGKGMLADLMSIKAEAGYTTGKWRAGVSAWGKPGVAVSGMGKFAVTLYGQQSFDTNVAIILPANPMHQLALWTFLSSEHFPRAVRELDQKLKVTCNTFVKVPFDLAHWQKVAAEKYPHGLPKPFSSDPTQWLFNGHPAGADQPLHVAVARLLGYHWPRQTGSSFADCPALEPDGLEHSADSDGIVCINAIKGEQPAAERLRTLLAAAYGRDWSSDTQAQLLSSLESKPATLDDWLRTSFFEEHCKLFHHRPFIWHLWDGLRDGFSVLVNYHKLDRRALEKLIYTYLGDWIARQKAAVDAGEEGSDAKLAAAQSLKASLEKILEGEAPYDIFVRWKPLAKQPLGWEPDLNDGVRLNIRPFLSVPDVAKKGAGILRWKPNIKWEKDRGTEPQRPKDEYPWFWGWDVVTLDFKGGTTFDGNRWNDCHFTTDFKRKARE